MRGALSNVIALWCLDPGESSGVAEARVSEEGTIAERLRGIIDLRTYTISGDEYTQMRQLFNRWEAFQLRCHRDGVKYEMVIEDFILTRIESSDREGLSPVRVTSAFQGYRHGLAANYEQSGLGPTRTVRPIMQLPSDAMTHATDERLKDWDLWVPGKVHEQDACRHLALRVANRSKKAKR